MDILIIESYFTGSHAQWAKGYKARSRHNVELLTLPGRYWKWRMHGAAVTLAGRFLEEERCPDLMIASDMLDLTTFLALTRQVTSDIPVAVYFHENQLTYPWQEGDRDVKNGRDAHYGFINYSSALVADKVFFNSKYHQGSFLTALEDYLKGMPEYNELASVEQIRAKSSVLYPGMALEGLAASSSGQGGRSKDGPPLILWNHRWEYDKNPEEFFRALCLMQDKGLDFEVAILGENFSRQPKAGCSSGPGIFEEARERLGSRVIHYGFLKDRAEYARWLGRGDILPVTSVHDFFGCSVAEAIYMKCLPILPQRLAYTEHIPERLKDRCFYRGFDGLCSRLEAAIRGIEDIREGGELDELSNHVARYGWSYMVHTYDEAFEVMKRANRVVTSIELT